MDFMLLSIISERKEFFEKGLDEDAFNKEESSEDHDGFPGDEGKLCAFVVVGKLYPPHSNDI